MLDEPEIDVEKSHVYSVDVGLLEVVKRAAGGDLNSQGQLYQLSKDKIQAAATETELVERARKNTTSMLESFLKGLGYERVTVHYVNP